jgi:uracil-DNA glycosylase
MDVKIEESWKKQLQEEFEKPYFIQLTEFVRSEYASQTIYPPAKLIFNAFDQCPFDQVKVVILGQDPYHGPGQAHGLCFSVNNGIDFPPSLRNIFKEIQSDTGVPIPSSGNLERWAQQGVLLLNATLTVRAQLAGSHQKKGWEQFTDSVIHLVANKLDHVVFILWGNYAISKGEFIDQQKHLVLKSVHPSPLSASRGFFGNKQFSRANNYLRENGKKQIQW